ncbi:MAG: hypothetical protein JWM16_4065 [Verrucomicrobiales bacterium]|nr:hypothetical protein [Verrucomicrobiales bacterium]
MISAKQDKQRVGFGSKTLRIAVRLVCVLAVAAVIAAALNRTAANLSHDETPAGLARGMLQGALMPLALPNLAMGRDVAIYSLNNTGRTYKLGYTLGVNVCGLLFFGIFFWRVSRWRKAAMTK